MGNTKKWWLLKYQCKLLKKLYWQEIRGWRNWKRYVSDINILTYISKCLAEICVGKAIQEIFSVWVSYPGNSLNFLYLQWMRGRSKLKRISLTNINNQMCNFLVFAKIRVGNARADFSYSIFSMYINCWKKHTCKECDDEVILKDYLTRYWRL